MAIFKYNPITPGSRQRSVVKYDYLYTGAPEKGLVGKKKSISGRNNQGVITVFHRGGRSKKYREIDFKRNKDGIVGYVARIERDPNRTAHIALINYVDGEKRYIVAQAGLRVGDELISNVVDGIKEGVSLCLRDFPLGSEISCVELYPGKGAQIARSAGSSCKLMSKDDKYAILKMKSGQVRKFLLECRATLGVVSNGDHLNISLGKAGAKRWLGIRPTVRGVAMNPIDHPHGGGEGRTSGGRHPVTPWGKPTKGYKTRDKKKWSNKFIVSKGRVN